MTAYRTIIGAIIIVFVTLDASDSFCFPGQNCWPSYTEYVTFKRKLDGYSFMPHDKYYSNITFMKSLAFTSYPGIIVMIKSESDVKECLLFANKNRILLSISSSGHDYNGRSIATGSLQMNFHLMNNSNVDMSDSSSPTGASLTAEPGATWISVFQLVDQYNKQIVGGSAQTVSVSGYTMGGGHSPICRSYGLAADFVLRFRMILYNGSVCTATPTKTMCKHSSGKETSVSDTDLFWAVRGGGGGTFGVLTSITFQIHDAPSGMVVFNTIFALNYMNNNMIGKNFFKMLFNLIPKLPKEWGGYVIPMFIPTGTVTTAIALVSLVHNGPWEAPSRTAIDELVKFNPITQVNATFTNYSSYYEYALTNRDPIYTWNLVGNAHMRSKETTQEHIDFFAGQAVKPELRGTTTGCVLILIGAGTSKSPRHASAISSDFRKADITSSCYLTWWDEILYDDAFEQMQTIDRTLEKLGHGAYLNEAAYGANNWKKRFWGENYARLEAIKEKYDPENIFTCHHCVGSDKVKDADIAVTSSKAVLIITLSFSFCISKLY